MPLGQECNSRRLYVAQSIIVVIVAAFVLWRPAMAAFHTVAFAGEMLPGPLKVQRWLTPEPQRMTTTFLRPDGTADEAEVFVVPGGKQRAAVLIFLGATVHGTNDPEAVKLGWALARTGFAVMFYWSETMGQEARLDAGDIPNVVAAFEHLARQEYVDPERVGLAGFSVGASFALAAAADPRIAHDIAFVNSFGGYYDLAGLIAQIAAGRALDGATETPWEVDELTKKVFTNTLGRTLVGRPQCPAGGRGQHRGSQKAICAAAGQLQVGCCCHFPVAVRRALEWRNCDSSDARSRRCHNTGGRIAASGGCAAAGAA